jgi:hypothetical protein
VDGGRAAQRSFSFARSKFHPKSITEIGIFFVSETNLNFSIKNNLSFTRAIFIDQAKVAPSA